jgi:hypothetical protein
MVVRSREPAGFSSNPTTQKTSTSRRKKHLGITRSADGSGVSFPARESEDPDSSGVTGWSIFVRQSKYLDSSNASLDPDGNRVELWEPRQEEGPGPSADN